MSIMTKEEKRQLFLSVKEAWPEITSSFAEKGVTRNTRAAAWQKAGAFDVELVLIASF